MNAQDAPARRSPFRIAGLVGRDVTPLLAERFAALDPTAPPDYRELAAILACDWVERSPGFVGVGGGQGAGKSTLSQLIASACEGGGLRVCVSSLDDFYLTSSERRALAERIHPLLETRGPPGTHDIDRCREAMESLKQDVETDLPIFDKGLDDRVGIRRVRGPFDIVLLEGWCVGATPVSEASLLTPINALERDRDPEGIWRRYVNARLAGEYARVWGMLDYLGYLRVPDLAAVRRWRFQQEEARPPSQRLSLEAVDSFIQFFERITLDMMESLPPRADFTVELADDHSIARAAFRSGS